MTAPTADRRAAPPSAGREVGRNGLRRARRSAGFAWPLLLLAGFGASVLLRSAVGGADVARSRPAGLVFAVLLVGLCLLGRTAVMGTSSPTGPRAGRGRSAGRAGAVGIGGAAVLCIPALVHLAALQPTSDPRPHGAFLSWAAVVTVVATAEEAFLRGVLFDRLTRYGPVVAIVVPAVAFAGLHLPLYGWGAVPLDLAVGIWLGALRSVSGSWFAPATAHVVADWAAWWLA